MTEAAELMGNLAKQEGFNETRVTGVGIYKASQSTPREPLCYEQGIIIVGQGKKRVYYGEQVYEYNPDNYLVLSVPIPAECETLTGPGEPMLAMTVDLDVRQLNGIIDQLENHFEPELLEKNVKAKGLFLSSATREIKETVMRLLRVLQSPVESKILGKALVRELIFRILVGENGATLLALTIKNTDLARIDKALKRIHSDYNQRIDVNSLASMVNMSASTFHRAFKEVTSSSPIQYLKKVRLTKARSLLVENGARVNEAATEVGYESSTQFSREFKRYYGRSPVQYSNYGDL